MTQQDLADAVGVTPGLVSQWERGKITPRRGTAERVDEKLKADGDALRALGYDPGDGGNVSRDLQNLSEVVERMREQLAELAEASAAAMALVEARFVEIEERIQTRIPQ